MTKLTIHWPDAAAERVEAAKGRLDVARRRLVARSREGILAVLGSVFDQWRDPESKWRRRFMDEFPERSGFSAEVARAGIELALESWTGEALARAVEGELRTTPGATPHTLSPFSMTSVILGGAIPMPSLLASVLPLCAQSPVLIKPASRDPVTPGLLAEAIAEVDPELGRCIEVVSFPSGDGESLGRFLAAECVVATGSNETIRQIRTRVRTSQRFVAYGHKLSVAVIDAEGWKGRDPRPLVEALALDIALWDQLGCLSPLALYLVGPEAARETPAFAGALAEALEALQQSLPRGETPLEAATAIRHERDEARIRAAAGAGVSVFESPGTEWTVVGESDAEWRPSPLHRFVRVHPVPRIDDLAKALRPVVRNLSSVALAGFPPSSDAREEVARELSRLGATRLCEAGRMQAPALDWHHDGQPILLPLARFTGMEIASD